MNKKNIEVVFFDNWPEYELIDSGFGQKLEKFGNNILIRPEPQALWGKSLSEGEWKKKADATFTPSEGGNREKGAWVEYGKKNLMEKGWRISFPLGNEELRFKLSLSGFKHVGIFPEQASNWEFIFNTTKLQESPKVLNLFAYTGGASLAARKAGAVVTHVDSVKPVLSWANENALESGFSDGIRWMAEDAMAFASREARRGNKYHGIVLDPPAYGRGAKGERWVLDDQLHQMISTCAQLLEPKGSWIVLNLYSMGYSPLIAYNLLREFFPNHQIELMELAVKDSFGKVLPLGISVRAVNI